LFNGLSQIGFKKVSNGLLAVIVIAILNFLVSYSFIQSNKNNINHLSEVINPYVETLEEFNLLVTESKMYTTNWVYLQNSVEDKEMLKLLHEKGYPELKQRLSGFFDEFESTHYKDSLIAVFDKFEELLAIEQEVMELLVSFDDYENPNKKFMGEDIIESEVLPRTSDIMRSLDRIIEKSHVDAKEKEHSILVAFNGLITVILVVSIVLLTAVILAAAFISKSIKEPVLKMRDIVLMIGRGELPNHVLKVTEDIIGEMVASVNKLAQNFSKTSLFANEIGKGNLTAEFEPLSEKDTLGNALLDMRKSLKIYSDHMEQQIQERTKEVLEKSIKLEHAYKEITDSITYAQRIQRALLKGKEQENRSELSHFILFKPKDIVSGDFYWALEKQDYLYLASADCTGHGVPGAFLTMLGTSFLNEINSSIDVLSPDEILNQLRNRMIKELKQTGKEGESKDGMDISLIRLNIKTNELIWAGANNPLWIVKNEKSPTANDYIIENGEESVKVLKSGNRELLEFKPDKQPIGYSYNQTPFSNVTLQLHKDDLIYIFTDGYADQFGGPNEKKYKYKTLKEKVLEISNLSLIEQMDKLDEEFEAWKGHYEQLDDVCVIGLKV
jgi:serine phosphatase RsbU (regulator of sigma subunit)